MKLKIYRIVLMLLVWAPAFDVHAYLDPGTGSLILQGLIASLAVALATIRVWWHWLLSMFGIKPKISESDDEESNKELDQESRDRAKREF